MVLAKMRGGFQSFYVRSCRSKKKHTYLSALIKQLKLLFINEKVNIYKCRFGNHRHIGHTAKATNWLAKMKAIPKLTLIDIKEGVLDGV